LCEKEDVKTMPGQIRFGIAPPQIHTKFPIDDAEVRNFILRAEELGFHSLWVQEQARLNSVAGALEAITILSYAAALTRKVLLGNAVFLINLRSPVLLAKAIASLDQLSHGRVIFAVGLGAATRLYSAYGLTAERRVARFNESLALISKLWTEDNVNFSGQFWQLKEASLTPKPFQKPHPPVWFGAHSDPAVRRAARIGDGFVGAGSCSTVEFRGLVKTLRQALEEANRDPGRFPIAKRVYISVDRERERAQKQTKEWFASYYGTAELADRVAVWGSPEECAGKLAEVISAGAEFLVLNPMFDAREQMEVLAAEVVPILP
jgi:probable F420-dependent oxidoreductase